jgi:hypothetical protein
LAELIKLKAKTRGTSINKIIQQLLEESLGVKPLSKGTRNRKDFSEFCGIWSKTDLKEFEEKTNEFEEIRPERVPGLRLWSSLILPVS